MWNLWNIKQQIRNQIFQKVLCRKQPELYLPDMYTINIKIRSPIHHPHDTICKGVPKDSDSCRNFKIFHFRLIL